MSKVEVGHRICLAVEDANACFALRRLSLKEHLHEYDDDWKCKCGQKLLVEISDGKIRVKGFVTPDGKFVPMSEAHGPVEDEREPTKTTEENRKKTD